MASSQANVNRPRIPGRCDICDHRDGKREMKIVQCSKCNVRVHTECYLVFPEGDGKDFVCFACAAVGKTFQAVDSHRSSNFYSIQQKKRPKECVLCSVSDGVHAMYPLFDYHGQGGRRICYTRKSKDKENGRSEKVLAWGHALCCLYLASIGFMYPCFKDGDYTGQEDDEETDPDTRPPNPELKITNEFRRMYGSGAMPYFRYYMTPKYGELDAWTKCVVSHQKELKCIECGLSDRQNSMRIPVQCSANDEDEHFEHKDKHRLRKNDVEPCTQALHVGCARWGDPSSTLRKCYWFPGTTRDDGKIDIDTVQCIYCKNHAENVDEKYQEKVRRSKALLNQRKLTGKARLKSNEPMRGLSLKKILSTTSSAVDTTIAKKRLSVDPLPLSSLVKTTKKSVSAEKSTKNSTKKKQSNSLQAAPRGEYRNKDQDRCNELDSSISVPINTGEKPTLAKRRRKPATEMSVVTEGDSKGIYDDLIKHQREIEKDYSLINGRKRYWKHQLSELSTKHFKSTWGEALEMFHNRLEKLRAQKSKNEGRKSTGLGSHSVDNVEVSEREVEIPEKNKEDATSKTSRRRVVDRMATTETRANRSGEFGAGREVIDVDIDETELMKKGRKKRERRSPDRFSKYFVGYTFEMGCEFTLDDFEEKP